jgi:hypothetical protein
MKDANRFCWRSPPSAEQWTSSPLHFAPPFEHLPFLCLRLHSSTCISDVYYSARIKLMAVCVILIDFRAVLSARGLTNGTGGSVESSPVRFCGEADISFDPIHAVCQYKEILFTRRMPSFGMLCRVDLVRTDVSDVFSTSCIRVTRRWTRNNASSN